MLALKGQIKEAATTMAILDSPQVENILADYDVPHKNRHKFTTYPAFRKFLEDAFNQWSTKHGPQRIAAENITSKTIEWLDKNYRDLPRIRLDYDLISEKLIIKLVSGEHDSAHRQFTAMMTDHVRALGISRRDLASRGAGREMRNNQRRKEPDDQFKPATRVMAEDRPTLVIEAGWSESMNQLRNDAHYWLTKTNGEVKIVLLIHVKYAQRVIELERWENRPNPRPTRRSTSADRPTKIQSLQIILQTNAPTIVSGGAPLLLPINLIFDGAIPAGRPTTGLSITAAELQEYAEEYFQLNQ
jgi:hypothetical protein